MHRKLFPLFFSFLSTFSFAQTSGWSWARSGFGSGTDEGYAVCTDNIGNSYVTGFFQSPTITFGSFTLTNNGVSDMFIAKYDPNGNVLWAKSSGGASPDWGYAVATDDSGNVFVTGAFFSSTITFGSFTLTNSNSNNGSDIFVVKYDVAGNVVWAKSAGGTASDQGSAICSDTAGNIFVTGYYGSPTISFGSFTLALDAIEDIFVVKYDPNGNVIWAKSGNGSGNDFGNGISADPSGNIFVTGNFADSITFGNISLANSNPPFYDAYVVKYDGAGNALWAKSVGGNNAEEGLSASADPFGNVFVSGGFYSPTITIGTFTLVNAGNGDLFIVKYDGAGNVLWAKSAGGNSTDYGFSVSTDTTGNVYMSGRFSSTSIAFGSNLLQPSPGASDPMFIVKYDSSGTVLCADALASGGDDQNAVSADRFGNVYVAGDFMMSPFFVGNDTLTFANSGSENIFVAKWNCSIGEGVNNIAESSGIEIFPNPSNGNFFIQGKNEKIESIEIDDAMGKVVKKISVENQQAEINLSNQPDGMYFVFVKTNSGIEVRKIILEE